MTLLTPKTVFVPFEWNGTKWVKRDDLPRFKEPEEAQQYFTVNSHVCFRNGQPIMLSWIECHEWSMIKEFLRGVGSRETVQ